MRRELEKAPAGATLLELIEKLGPEGMTKQFRRSLGFGFQVDKKDAEISAADGRPGVYTVGEGGIEAEVSLSFSSELKTIVQSIAITNTGDTPSAPITRLDAIKAPLEVRVKDRLQVLTIGGGTTHGYYPTAAYREERLTFGKPLQWEDPEPTFTRYWVAQRIFKISSGEKSLSSVDKWPVFLTGWDGEAGFVGFWTALVWSGRYEIELSGGSDWAFGLRGGPIVKEMVLEPGETVRLPDVHIGVYGGSDATIEDGANSVRRQLAEVIAPDVQGKRPWPYVAYHHWFGIEERINAEIAMQQIDTAAELGLEFLEIDAAWFGAASGKFYEGIGNWERVDEVKFPNGLEPVAEYAKSKGIGFGLWFEPERVRFDSDWATEHADFFWSAAAPTYKHLNLTRKDAQDALIEMLSNWITKLDIRWLRWDYNVGNGPSDWWDPVDPTGKLQFAYFEGLYRVWDTLLDRHPNLMFDNCAGGGRRSDFGTSMRAATMVISDHAEDPHVCRNMQIGAARFIPGNWANSSIYCNDVDPDEYVDHLALTSRMAGAISLSGWISHWSEKQKKFVKRYLDAFKTYRHLLMKDFHRLTPYPRTPDDWDVVEFLDPATGEAVVLGYRVEGPDTTRVVKPVRLDAEKTYRVVDPFTGAKEISVSGADLMAKGMSYELKEHDSAIRHLIPE